MCSSLTVDTIIAVPQSRLATMFEPVLQGSKPIEGAGLVVPAGGAAGGGGELAEGVPHEEAPPLPQAPDGAYVIDRDAGSWRHVINYLRARRSVYKNGVRVGSAAGEVILPDSKAELHQLVVEARYYRLTELEGLAQAGLEFQAALEHKIEEAVAVQAHKMEQVVAAQVKAKAEISELKAKVTAQAKQNKALEEKCTALGRQVSSAQTDLSDRVRKAEFTREIAKMQEQDKKSKYLVRAQLLHACESRSSDLAVLMWRLWCADDGVRDDLCPRQELRRDV
jgi:hypothetical protein